MRRPRLSASSWSVQCLIWILFSSLCGAATDLLGRHVETFTGKEALPAAVRAYLYEEQVLHNKDLWPENAFASDIDPAYLPEARPVFKLGYYLVPETLASFLESDQLNPQIKSQLREKVDGQTHYRLFVHPESEAHYRFLSHCCRYVGPDKSAFSATPQSSYRSLIVWSEKDPKFKPFIAKVSLDRQVISGIDRLVSEKEVRRSISNQRALETFSAAELKEMNLSYFPETAGLVLEQKNFRYAPQKIGGQLIREIPEAVLNGSVKWVSFSALMSPRRKGGPWIISLIRKSGLSPEDFIRRYLIDDYMHMFEELSLKRGLNFEPHSQNLSWELRPSTLRPLRWVLRDFGGVWPDIVRMTEDGGPVEVYEAPGNAETFKFAGGRINSAASYLFFYRRQVFEMVLDQVSREMPELKRKRNALKKELDQRFLELMEKYNQVKVQMSWDSDPQLELERKIRASTYLSWDPDRMADVTNESFALELYRLKRKSADWVLLDNDPNEIDETSRLPRTRQLRMTTAAIFLLNSRGRVLGFAVLTPQESSRIMRQSILRNLIGPGLGGGKCERVHSH